MKARRTSHARGAQALAVRRRGRRLADERGSVLIEALVASVVLVIGVMSTLNVFTSSLRSTVSVQRHKVAQQVAQRELEDLQSLEYDELRPVSATYSNEHGDTAHENDGDTMRIRTTPELREYLVGIDPDFDPELNYPNPGPEAFEVGGDGAQPVGDRGAITGKIYRYITWREEGCTQGTCGSYPGGQDTKRLTVAITIDPSPSKGIGPSGPVWVSSVATPAQSKSAFNPPDPTPGGDGSKTAGLFYLYDQPCSSTSLSYPDPYLDHPTRDTAATGDPESGDHISGCWNPTPDEQTDLMGGSLPYFLTGTWRPPPWVRFSSDLDADGATYPAGLRMTKQGARSVGQTGVDCSNAPTSYASNDSPYDPTDGDPVEDGPNKWNVHAWTTRLSASTVTMTGTVSLSLHAALVNGGSGRGVMCAQLIDRPTGWSVGSPPIQYHEDCTNHPDLNEAECLAKRDTRIASFPIDLSLVQTARGINHFTVRHSFDDLNGAGPGNWQVESGRELVLVLSMRSDSDRDMVLLYSSPMYPTHLNVREPNS